MLSKAIKELRRTHGELLSQCSVFWGRLSWGRRVAICSGLQILLLLLVPVQVFIRVNEGENPGSCNRPLPLSVAS